MLRRVIALCALCIGCSSGSTQPDVDYAHFRVEVNRAVCRRSFDCCAAGADPLGTRAGARGGATRIEDCDALGDDPDPQLLADLKRGSVSFDPQFAHTCVASIARETCAWVFGVESDGDVCASAISGTRPPGASCSDDRYACAVPSTCVGLPNGQSICLERIGVGGRCDLSNVRCDDSTFCNAEGLCEARRRAGEACDPKQPNPCFGTCGPMSQCIAASTGDPDTLCMGP